MLSNPFVNISTSLHHPMHISYRLNPEHALASGGEVVGGGRFQDSPSSTLMEDASSLSIAIKGSRAKKRLLTKKTVRWGSSYTYRSTNHMEDVPIMWYNRQDLEVFQREKRKIIRALKHVKGDMAALEGTKYVTRGFECYQSVAFNRMIRKQRQTVVQRVLQLQQQQKEQQRKQGDGDCPIVVDDDDEEIYIINSNMDTKKIGSDTLFDPPVHNDDNDSDPVEALAQLAREESKWARNLALELGMKDAETNGMVWQEFFATDPAMDSFMEADDDSSTCISASSGDDSEGGSAAPISGDEDMLLGHPS